VRLITLDPGHFHAALIQKETYPGLDSRVAVFAPLGPDILDYLARVAGFNSRKLNPTNWELELHLCADFLERLTASRPGDFVVIAGRNRLKMDRIRACVDAGLHVLADKPWIISSHAMPALEDTLSAAAARGVAAYDIMTERYEITSILQRILVNDPDIFGSLLPGSLTDPAVCALSIHYIMKLVAGEPVRRPAWFFDITEQGEALADVGTHVVDLVQWTAFPDRILHYRTAVQFLKATRWPTILTLEQFRRVTGESAFPDSLAPWISGGSLHCFCNNTVDYVLNGVHVSLDIRWDWQAAEGRGDVYQAAFRGSLSTVEIRQQAVPELYVRPSSPALHRRIAVLQSEFPGIAVEEQGGEAQIVIPSVYRNGHEAHFAQVTRQFFEYLRGPASIPSWENSNMLLKYWIAARGTETAAV
jgi:predicted dehydrogenase